MDTFYKEMMPYMHIVYKYKYVRTNCHRCRKRKHSNSFRYEIPWNHLMSRTRKQMGYQYFNIFEHLFAGRCLSSFELICKQFCDLKMCSRKCVSLFYWLFVKDVIQSNQCQFSDNLPAIHQFQFFTEIERINKNSFFGLRIQI